MGDRCPPEDRDPDGGWSGAGWGAALSGWSAGPPPGGGHGGHGQGQPPPLEPRLLPQSHQDPQQVGSRVTTFRLVYNRLEAVS